MPMHLTLLHMLWRCVFWRSMKLARFRRMLAGVEDHETVRLELADRKKFVITLTLWWRGQIITCM